MPREKGTPRRCDCGGVKVKPAVECGTWIVSQGWTPEKLRAVEASLGGGFAALACVHVAAALVTGAF